MKKRAFLAPLAVSVGAVLDTSAGAHASTPRDVTVEGPDAGQLSAKTNERLTIKPSKAQRSEMALALLARVASLRMSSHYSHYSSSY